MGNITEKYFGGNAEAPTTRDLRQMHAIEAWRKNCGKGTCVWPTGTGKTRIALLGIKRFIESDSEHTVLIIVPTLNLKDQWNEQLEKAGVKDNCQVVVINTAARYSYDCDMLVIDEIHTAAADVLRAIFETISYSYVLGLTATFERLDGKHALLEKYCPVVDTMTTQEAEENGWLARYDEYMVLLDPPDIDVYDEITQEFTEHFEYFGCDFNLIMSMVGPTGYRQQQAYQARTLDKPPLNEIRAHVYGFTRTMQKRKQYIDSHPMKIEIAEKIIKAREGKKIITFSNTIKMASQIPIGNVYTGAGKSKKQDEALQQFNQASTGIINSCKKLIMGADIKGLSVAIVLGMDSSALKNIQRRGRVLRVESGKQAEVFNLVLRNTVETDWFLKSHTGDDYKVIDINGLNAVLEGKEPELLHFARRHAYHY